MFASWWNDPIIRTAGIEEMIAAGPVQKAAVDSFDAEDDVFRAKELAFVEASQGRIVEENDRVYFSGDFLGLKSVDIPKWERI